jgi:hypothetical protein
MFACRMITFVSTIPISHPSLPNMTKHPLWDAFEFQIDRALYSLCPK